MAFKVTCSLIILAVLFCTVSAVTVTVGDLGDIIEGSVTRMMCNIVRTRPSSTGDPVIIWNNITSGSVDQIASFQSGFKFLQPDYVDRFDVDINDGSLVISNTLRSDSGTYQCSVTIFDDIPGAGDDDVVLDVIYLETPLLGFDTPIIEGDRVELTCSVVANPAPVITFCKDGVNVQSGGQSIYVIHSVDRNDAGNYECEVTNGAGTKSASQMLEIYYAPEIAFGNIEASPSERIVVSFDVDASPPAVYEWTTNPPTADIDSNPETYTFVVSDNIGTIYTVKLNTSNVVGATRSSVKVTVVARTTTLMTTNAFTTQQTLPPDDDKDTGLIIGIFFIGLFVGALGVIIAHVTYVKIKQIPNRKSAEKRKVEKGKQETYMEYVSDPSSPTYQDLQHGVKGESAYVNVKTSKNSKT